MQSNTTPRPTYDDAYLLEAITLHCGFDPACSCGDCDRVYPCLGSHDPLQCFEFFRRGERAATCSGCDERRSLVTSVGGERYCQPCSARLVAFVMRGAA